MKNMNVKDLAKSFDVSEDDILDCAIKLTETVHGALFDEGGKSRVGLRVGQTMVGVAGMLCDYLLADKGDNNALLTAMLGMWIAKFSVADVAFDKSGAANVDEFILAAQVASP